MAEPKIIFNSLNEQQLMMMRLLKKPLHEDDFVQLRKLAAKLLSARLDDAMEKWERKNQIDVKDDNEKE
jgi:hypothetical protein